MSMFKTENGLKEINKNTDAVPWYWGRKFWGVLVILSILPSLYYISLLNKSFLNTMAKYFEYIARGFYLILETKLKFELHITGRTSTYYIILYYIRVTFIFNFQKEKNKYYIPWTINISVNNKHLGSNGRNV